MEGWVGEGDWKDVLFLCRSDLKLGVRGSVMRPLFSMKSLTLTNCACALYDQSL